MPGAGVDYAGRKANSPHRRTQSGTWWQTYSNEAVGEKVEDPLLDKELSRTVGRFLLVGTLLLTAALTAIEVGVPSYGVI